MAEKNHTTITCDRCGTTTSEERIPGKPRPDLGYYVVELKPIAGGHTITKGDMCTSCKKYFDIWWNNPEHKKETGK